MYKYHEWTYGRFIATRENVVHVTLDDRGLTGAYVSHDENFIEIFGHGLLLLLLLIGHSLL